jgi:restriction endonuclease S subunit
MSEQWEEVSIADLLVTSIGGVWGEEPGRSDVDVRVYRSTDFNADGRLSVECGASRSITTGQLGSRLLLEGDILLEKSGGGPNQPVGRVVFVNDAIDEPAVCANFVQLLRPDSTQVVPKFLFYLLWSAHDSNVTLEYQAQTTGIRNLRTKDYLQRTILVPPLLVQRRIVDLMTHLDTHIANLRAENDTLTCARDSALTQALSGALPSMAMSEDWVEATVGELAIWRGGLTPSMANIDFWADGTIPWLSSKEVVGGTLTEVEKCVTDKALQETSLRLNPAGVVVIVVRSGILLHTFPVAYVPFECAVNQDLKVGIPRDSVDGRFLYYLLHALGPDVLRRYRKTGTTVQSINVPALLEQRVALPPLPVQHRIVDLVTAFDSQISALKAETEALHELRSAVLAGLLSGGVSLREAYDALLLEAS